MTQYYTVRDCCLYAYDTDTKETLYFFDNKWELSPFTKWTLEHTFELKEVSKEHAMKITKGVKPNFKEIEKNL
jgi:Zn-dependent M16 (insulinase) family peptidase